MKKAAIIILCLIFVLQLSACTSKSGNETAKTSETTQKTKADIDTSGTDTVTIDGVVYRNMFSGSMEYTGFKGTDGKTPVLKNADGSFYRVDDTAHDWIYKDSSEESVNGENLYCRDEQWQELHEFYYNPDNLSANCVITPNNADDENKIIQNIDADKLFIGVVEPFFMIDGKMTMGYF